MNWHGPTMSNHWRYLNCNCIGNPNGGLPFHCRGCCLSWQYGHRCYTEIWWVDPNCWHMSSWSEPSTSAAPNWRKLCQLQTFSIKMYFYTEMNTLWKDVSKWTRVFSNLFHFCISLYVNTSTYVSRSCTVCCYDLKCPSNAKVTITHLHTQPEVSNPILVIFSLIITCENRSLYCRK